MSQYTIVDDIWYGFWPAIGGFRDRDGALVDTMNADAVKDIVKDWDYHKVEVSYHAKTDSVIYRHENVALSYHRPSKEWSAPLDIPPATKVWDCPTCNYRLTYERHNDAAFDYPCPRCKQSTLSMFRLRELPREESIFAALDELCLDMSERTGQPWGYNKGQWRNALKDPPTNITEIVKEQNRQMLRDFNKTQVEIPHLGIKEVSVGRLTTERMDKIFKEELPKMRAAIEASNNEPSALFALLESDESATWICSNHAPGLEVTVPKGEGCSACGGSE